MKLESSNLFHAVRNPYVALRDRRRSEQPVLTETSTYAYCLWLLRVHIVRAALLATMQADLLSTANVVGQTGLAMETPENLDLYR